MQADYQGTEEVRAPSREFEVRADHAAHAAVEALVEAAEARSRRAEESEEPLRRAIVERRLDLRAARAAAAALHAGATPVAVATAIMGAARDVCPPRTGLDRSRFSLAEYRLLLGEECTSTPRGPTVEPEPWAVASDILQLSSAVCDGNAPSRPSRLLEALNQTVLTITARERVERTHAFVVRLERLLVGSSAPART